MTSEKKSDHDSLHLGEAITSLRQNLLLGDDVQTDTVWREKIIQPCINWIRRGRKISWQEAQDIASQAVENVLTDLLSPKVSPEEASLRLKTALNTVRADYVRKISVEQSFGEFEPYEAAFGLYKEVDFVAQIDEEVEQTCREQHLLKVIDRLHGFMEISLEDLRPRDYAILYELYDLTAIGMAEPTEPSPLPYLKPGARRVAAFRARRRFIDKLDQLLREACESLKTEAKVLEDVIKLIEGGHIADVLAVQQRQQPN